MQTSVVYGHVVASNPLGEVHISPLAATLEQIKSCFPNTTVSLPDPLPLLASLASFYLETKQDVKAFEILTRLDWLIQSMEDKGQMVSLLPWSQSDERKALSESVDAAWGRLGETIRAEQVCPSR
jgi:hypothetical protein